MTKMMGRGLAYWSAHRNGPASIDIESYEAMLAHPRFEEACRLVATNMFARYRNNRVLARSTKDVTRYFFGWFALYLDATGGLTLSSIRDLVSNLGIASPGRAHAILLRLRTLGYVRRDTEQKDRRVRRYVPTADMKEAFLQSSRDDLEALALLEPEARQAASRLDEPEFCAAYIKTVGEGIIGVVKSGGDPTSVFTARDSGSMILFEIMQSAQPGDAYPPRGPLNCSVTDLAAKYEVSRSHVLKMLRDAEKEGLLVRNADQRTCVFSETLRTAVTGLLVTMLAGNALAAHAAIEATAIARMPARAMA